MLLRVAALLMPASLLLGRAARAQEAALEPGTRVVEVRVEGAGDAEAAAAVRDIFGIQPGDVLDLSDVRLGIKRVFLTGPWADVRAYAEPLPSGVELVLVVVPDLVIGDVVLDVKGSLPVERLRPAAGLSPGDRFRPARVGAAKESLKRALAELGYPRAEVQAEIERMSGAEHRVTFRIEPGDPTRIRSLRIVGQPRLGRRDLEKLLGARPGAPFDRVRLERGLLRVRDLLVERHHLRAATAVEEVRYDEERRSVEIVVRVDAGPRYVVAFRGNALIPSATLDQIVNERRVGALTEASERAAVRALEEHYRRMGYAHVAVRVQDVPAYPPYADKADRVLCFVIDEGRQVLVREVLIEGGRHKEGRALADAVRAFVEAEAPDHGLLEPIDRGDLTDGLVGPPRPIDPKRPVEIADEQLEPWVLPPFLLLVQRPIYFEPLYRAAADHLAALYHQEGFLSARVEGPEPIWLEEGAAVRVRYRVFEGTQTRIAAVRFIPEPSVPLSELLTAAAFEPGDPADQYAIEETRLALERSLREQGFPFAKVRERLVPLPEPGYAEVVYNIEEGPRVRIGQIRVRGNQMTRDFVIIDRVLLKPGDWYSASRVEESRQRLLRMGLFSAVSIGFLDDRPDATVRDLLVEVRERPRYSIEAGLGASLEDGPRVFSAFEVRNISGFGVGVRGRAQLNYPRALYDLVYDPEDPRSPLYRFDDKPPELRWAYFTEGQLVLTAEMPKVYGIPFDGRLHVDSISLRAVRPAYTLMKSSILGGFEAQPTSWLRVEPQIEAETSDFDCPTASGDRSCTDERDGHLYKQDVGRLAQFTLRLLSSLDLRDDPFRPHSGIFTSLTTDVALGFGMLRDVSEVVQSNFLRVTGVVSGYVPLAPDFTLALTLRSGNIFPLFESCAYVPPYKLFYLGGTGSIRGFHEDEILPADHLEETCADRFTRNEGEKEATRLGGNFFVNGRTELRMAALGDLELGTFIDAGQLADDVTNVRLYGWAIGAGFGFRYNTPVGPFAIDFGWKVVDGQRKLPPILDAERLNVHFSIGYF